MSHGSHGFVLWFTGLSGSGKSTLTSMVAAELRRRGVHVETLDGDEVRKHLSKGLGFSREDRDENIRRIGFVAKLIARSGGCAIAAAISPYRQVRGEVRRTIDHFVEVYTECPIAVLAERDPKGLYKKALAGEIKNFTGVDDPYEAPESPEVHLWTDREQPEDSLGKILESLEAQGLIPAWGRLLGGSEPPGTESARLVAPHGRDLVDRTAREDATALTARAAELPSIELDAVALWSMVAIATGAYSPLAGFMTSKDYLRVTREMRLESGLPWALPVTLSVPEAREVELRRSSEVALLGPGSRCMALLHIEDLFRADDHPGKVLVGGEIRCFDPTLPADFGPWVSPARARQKLAALGWARVVAVQSAAPPLASHEYLARAALESADGLLVQPTVSPTDELPVAVRAACWTALLGEYFARDSWVVAPYPRPNEADERRLAIHDALVAKNYGASHLLVLGRRADEARGAQGWFNCYAPGELGIEVLPTSPAVLSPKLGIATIHSAPDAGPPLDVRQILQSVRAGQSPGAALIRPEVLAVLQDHLGRTAR